MEKVVMEVRLTEESKEVLNRLSEALRELTEAVKQGRFDRKYVEEQLVPLLENMVMRFTSNTSGGPS